jgi:putative oxygen-independent coproporphyrinogen III oxidase
MNKMELYIHIPFCVRKCAYCDFLSFPSDADDREAYTEALTREITYWGGKLDHPVLSTIFIGGGTPSWLEVPLMEKILKTVWSNFQISKNLECTMEVNPGTVTYQALLDYRSLGINRLSIGLQSANDEELKTLGRIHDYRRFLKTFESARRANFSNINVDLMTGIPGQTLESLHRSLSKVVLLGPTHISAYDLIIEEGTPFYKRYHADEEARRAGEQPVDLPDEDTEYQMTRMTEDFLRDKGFRQYEVSNFARPGYRCRHNVGYWKRREYLGVGLGAASFIDETRWNETDDFHSYLDYWRDGDIKSPASNSKSGRRVGSESMAGLELKAGSEKNAESGSLSNFYIQGRPKTLTNFQRLTKKDAMEEFMFLGLRMNEGVSLDEFESYFGLPLLSVYGRVVEKYQEEGMLCLAEGRLLLTRRGREVSNEILADFLF